MVQQDSPSSPQEEAIPEIPANFDLLALKSSETQSILMTGAHHARELITIQMVLFSASKLLQNGLIKKDPYSMDMLK